MGFALENHRCLQASSLAFAAAMRTSTRRRHSPNHASPVQALDLQTSVERQLVGLQRSAGNRAVTSLLQRSRKPRNDSVHTTGPGKPNYQVVRAEQSVPGRLFWQTGFVIEKHGLRAAPAQIGWEQWVRGGWYLRERGGSRKYWQGACHMIRSLNSSSRSAGPWCTDQLPGDEPGLQRPRPIASRSLAYARSEGSGRSLYAFFDAPGFATNNDEVVFPDHTWRTLGSIEYHLRFHHKVWRVNEDGEATQGSPLWHIQFAVYGTKTRTLDNVRVTLL